MVTHLTFYLRRTWRPIFFSLKGLVISLFSICENITKLFILLFGRDGHLLFFIFYLGGDCHFFGGVAIYCLFLVARDGHLSIFIWEGMATYLFFSWEGVAIYLIFWGQRDCHHFVL